MTLSILVAPSGFKESLSVDDVTRAIGDGIRRALPEARILNAPMVDGGEGTVQALVRATGGRMVPARVTGPVGEPVDSFLGLLGGPGPRTAVIEMAAAAGLSLVPPPARSRIWMPRCAAGPPPAAPPLAMTSALRAAPGHRADFGQG